MTLSAPARVARGETFEVTVRVTGGAGPVVGVALVDRAHRWYARPAPSAGWQIAKPPVINTPDQPDQQEWLSRRPKRAGRNLSYVNVPGTNTPFTNTPGTLNGGYGCKSDQRAQLQVGGILYVVSRT